MAKIQTVLAVPMQREGEPVPFSDSVVIEADGNPEGKVRKDDDGNIAGYTYMHYPMTGNSYYEYLKQFA